MCLSFFVGCCWTLDYYKSEISCSTFCVFLFWYFSTFQFPSVWPYLLLGHGAQFDGLQPKISLWLKHITEESVKKIFLHLFNPMVYWKWNRLFLDPVFENSFNIASNNHHNICMSQFWLTGSFSLPLRWTIAGSRLRFATTTRSATKSSRSRSKRLIRRSRQPVQRRRRLVWWRRRHQIQLSRKVEPPPAG